MKGFTLIELMVTLVIVAIGVALAVPTWQSFVEKRQLTAAAEDIASFINLAQSQAIKINDEVNVSWVSTGDHDDDFCLGISAAPKATPCDCAETVATATDFCAVGASTAATADGTAYRVTKTDFVDVDFEFMHMRPAVGDFEFEPIRGVVVNFSDADIVDNDWLFRMHSNQGSGSSRLFGVQLSMGLTGRLEICHEDSRKMRLGAYPEC